MFLWLLKYIVIQNIQKLLNFVYRVTETTTGQFSGQKSTQTGFFVQCHGLVAQYFQCILRNIAHILPFQLDEKIEIPPPFLKKVV